MYLFVTILHPWFTWLVKTVCYWGPAYIITLQFITYQLWQQFINYTLDIKAYLHTNNEWNLFIYLQTAEYMIRPMSLFAKNPPLKQNKNRDRIKVFSVFKANFTT